VGWMLVCSSHGTQRGESARVSGKLRTARGMKLNNTTFYGYIRVLLIKTNSMIYICYTKYGGNADICVLAVVDDELSVGDDDTLSRRQPKDGTRVGGLWKTTWLVLDL
jgi:hypothetical protein